MKNESFWWMSQPYRERLNALVFGFAGMEQYQTMLRLMLEQGLAPPR